MPPPLLLQDCSWGFVPESPGSNEACDGGDAWAGLGWVVEAGGIAANDDYQYRGQDGYCIKDAQPAAKFKVS